MTGEIEDRFPLTSHKQSQRIACLGKVRSFLISQPEAVHEILREVCTHKALEYEIEATIQTLEGAAAEIEHYRPPVVDQIAVYMPSNVLLYSYALYALVPSLYSERVSLRPSAQFATQMIRLHELLAPTHDLPIELEHVTQRDFMDGTVGEADVVVFTGTHKNGQQVRGQLRPDQLFIFLGSGINPVVVTKSANVERSVADIVDIRLLNSGQDCLAPDAIFVDEHVAPEFLQRLISRLEVLRVGACGEKNVDYGPLVYGGALEESALQLFRHHKDIMYGGEVNFKSWVVHPTILVRTIPAKISVVEFFAPIFNILVYHREGDVIAMLNSSAFVERALGASIYGTSVELAQTLSVRHTTTYDTTLLTIDDGNAPFGGRGHMANMIAKGPLVVAEPVLLSKALVDHYGKSVESRPSVRTYR